eukprot:5694772-Heterocapsa_arctica.AAC.1
MADNHPPQSAPPSPAPAAEGLAGIAAAACCSPPGAGAPSVASAAGTATHQAGHRRPTKLACRCD